MNAKTMTTVVASGSDRRVAVMETALRTFARFGYRKTSMEDVAQAAGISRPGIYFLFGSKEELFRSSVLHALSSDISRIEQVLATPGLPLGVKVLEAFCCWASRYIGPAAADTSAVIENNPDLLGEVTTTYPKRFVALITSAIDQASDSWHGGRALELAQTLVSLSIGLKYQVGDPAEFRERFALALGLMGLEC
jgi:AcrR family transcriptional regulator